MCNFLFLYRNLRKPPNNKQMELIQLKKEEEKKN